MVEISRLEQQVEISHLVVLGVSIQVASQVDTLKTSRARWQKDGMTLHGEKKKISSKLMAKCSRYFYMDGNFVFTEILNTMVL